MKLRVSLILISAYALGLVLGVGSVQLVERIGAEPARVALSAEAR